MKHVIGLRKLLFDGLRFPLESAVENEITKSGVYPILFESLTKYRDSEHEMVIESLNIIGALIEQEVIDLFDFDDIELILLPVLRSLLDHPSRKVIEHAIICLSIVARNRLFLWRVDFNPIYAEYVARFLAVEGNSLSLRRNTANFLSDLCDTKRELELVLPLLNIAVTYIHRRTAEDDHILQALFTGISNITEWEERIGHVLDTGVIVDVCSILLGKCDQDLISAGMQILTHMLRGTISQMKAVLDHGVVLDILREYPLVDCFHVMNIIAGRQPHLIIDDDSLIEKILKNCVKSWDENAACSLLANLCLNATDVQAKQLAKIPEVIQALFHVSIYPDFDGFSFKWDATVRIFSIGGPQCIQFIKYSDRFKAKIDKLMEFHILQRLLRFPATRDKADFATFLVGVGFNQNAKVQGTNITLAQYALTVSIPTGVRLNQLSVLILLLGPKYSQRLCPKHGIWLPRDLWIMLRQFYFLPIEEIKDIDVPKNAFAKDKKMTAIRDFSGFSNQIQYRPEEKDEEKKEHCFY